MRDVYVFDAIRTPRGKGKADGALAKAPPHELIRQLTNALRERVGADAVAKVERLVLSAVGQVGAQGGHLALVSRMWSELPDDVSCMTINNFCVGGLTAFDTLAADIRAGGVDLAIAAGVECMSQVPFLADKASYYVDRGLSEALAYVPVALSADYMAHREGIARETLDELTHQSHQKAAAAWKAGAFERSVVPVRNEDGSTALDRDECIRASMGLDKLAALAPAFEAEGRAGYDDLVRSRKPEIGYINHSLTVAHCPPIADGAAIALLGDLDAGRALGLEPLARVVGWKEAAADPVDQLTAGFAAMDGLLAKTGLGLDRFGLIEFMEAFAPTPAKFYRDYEPDPDRVNVNGGHLAMGHPMGATGLILLATLAHEMRARDEELGLVVAHGGSGVGAACVLERA